MADEATLHPRAAPARPAADAVTEPTGVALAENVAPAPEPGSLAFVAAPALAPAPATGAVTIAAQALAIPAQKMIRPKPAATATLADQVVLAAADPAAPAAGSDAPEVGSMSAASRRATTPNGSCFRSRFWKPTCWTTACARWSTARAASMRISSG
jgi:hypothetical protein